MMGASKEVEVKAAAERLLEHMRNNLGDKITPEQAKAMMTLKGLSEAAVASKSTINPDIFRVWLSGSMPILPGRKVELLELVLGVEQGEFTADRVHVLDINESAVAGGKLATMVDDVMPWLQQGARRLVVDKDGKEKWAHSSRLHVVQMDNGATVVLRHTPKKLFSSRSIADKISGIREDAQGMSATGVSELVVSGDLAALLSKKTFQEGDDLAAQLVEELKNTQELQMSSSIGLLKSTMGRPQ
jgi:hypothetical protein